MFSSNTSNILVGSADVDSNFEYNTLLLRGDGTNGAQNNTFIDGSSNNFTVTRNGNTTQGTFSPYGANWSIFFDGSGDFLSVADNVALQMGSGAFTLEAWVFRSVSGVAHSILAKGGSSSGLQLSITSTNVLRFTDTTTNIDSTGTIPIGTWTHVAVVREGTGSNQLKLYINGTNDGTGTSATNFTQTEEFRIGRDRSGASDFSGYISNVRVVKGSAVYTSNFTPQTAPLIAITNTSLLTCQSNRLIDNSSNAFAITRNGDISAQDFSPFSPSAAYSASIIGGSGYFDGTGDYLSIADNAALEFGSSNFTVEFWCYWRGNTASQILWTKGADLGSAFAPFLFWKPSGSSLVLYASSNGTSWDIAAGTTLATMDANQWSHFALVRNGNTIKFYKNGVEQASITTSLAFWNNTQAMTIGAGAGGVTAFNSGYISDARIVVGTAVYTGAFTPPAAPLTAITNTSLLLNFTNAGVIDNAMMNDLETVGSAQISTTQSKFGGGSMYFTGNGDRLKLLNTPQTKFGAGAVTIECWIYPTSNPSGAFGTIASDWTTGANPGPSNWLLYIDNTTLYFSATNGNFNYYDASQRSLSTTYSKNTWTHVAVTFDGTTLRLFKDGTVAASNTFNGFSTNSASFTSVIEIGGYTGAYGFIGYIDDLRITKGVARYTTNFTPPTSPFPNQ